MVIQIIERAAKSAGGIKKLAAALGVKHQTFYSWQKVPAERVLDLERITGISRQAFRPDLYPAPSDSEGRAA